MKWVVITLVLVAGLAMWFFGTQNEEAIEQTSDTLVGTQALNIKTSAERDLAISAAKDLWRIKNLEGMDFSSGPCLSNNIINDWVADIVHNPRIVLDDDPANQCSAYRDGTAQHFVELDPQGIFVRAE